MSTRLAEAIKNTAAHLGVNPVDLATAMSYETGGTFDEWKAGPTTQWGQHRGLIQWGGPQRKRYGVYKGMPVEEQVAAAGRYLKDHGVRPGMGLLEIYSAINAGGVGEKFYGRSDANNGGAPGSVRDKVYNQMGGHKAKAAALLGGTYRVPMQDPYADEQGAPINYDIHSETSAPTPLTVAQQVAQDELGPKPYDTFGEHFEAAGSSGWYTAWAFRKFSEGAIDMTYSGPDPDAWKQVAETIPEHYHDYLLGAGSARAYEGRLKYALEDMERQQRLGASADGGITASLLTGILDPIAIPISAATGGFGASLIRGAATTASRVAIGAATGGVVNAATEYGARELLDDPNTDPLMAFGIGAVLGGVAGPLSRNPATQVEAQIAQQLGQSAINDAKGFILSGKGSVGAAQNPHLRDSLLATEWDLSDADVATAVGGRARFDVAGQMTTSEEPLTRLVGQSFFEETVGFKDHSVVPDSASVKATAIERKYLGNLNAVYKPALQEWMRMEGIGRMNLVGHAQKAAEFHRMVYDFAEDAAPSPNTPAPVARAGQALRSYYAGYQKEISESGLRELNPDPNYVPKYADHARIAELDQKIEASAMEAFIRQAILAHTPGLTDDIADRMAKGYWRNIRRAGYGIEDAFHGSLGMGDKDAFKRAFQDALEGSGRLTGEQLDQVYDLLSGIVDDASRSSDKGAKGISRLKHRTLLDYSFSASVPTRDGGRVDLSMKDLFVRDAEFTARRYGRHMSGRVAFAKTQIRNPKTGELLMDGIKTEADLDKLKNHVREAWRNQPGDYRANEAKMKAAIDNIDFGWKRINGIPVYGQEREFNQWVRRLKGVQFVRLMSNMGLNQVQESWKLVTMTGFRAAATQLPAIRRIVNEASGASMARKDELLAELEAMTGTGLDGLWGKADFSYDDDRIGATAASKLGYAFDQALDFGSSLTSSVSLMKAIHTYQQRWAVKAIAQQMYGIAKRTRTEDGFDLSKLRGRDRERLASLGIGDEEAAGLFRNLLTHSEASGKRLVSLGSNKWEPEQLTKFTYLLNRYTNRLVQQNDVGGLSKWMAHPIAQLFTQFRSFVLGAWAKSTLYSLHHMDPRMLVLLLGEFAFGTATYMLRQAPIDMATEEGTEKFWNETMDPVNLAKNGWARTATASVLPMIADSALMFTPIGPQFGSARSSGSPTDALFGSPAGGHLSEMARASKGFIDSTVEGRDMAQSELNAAKRAFMPLGNWVPLAALFSHLIQDRPKSPPRD